VRARLGTTFQSLTVRNYRLFAIGQIIKLIAVWMLFVAQDWLVLELTDNSAYALGVVTALQFTPTLLLTLYGGKLADRHDKRRLLMWANAVFAILALAMGLLVATGTITLILVFIFAAAMGATTAIETPVRQSFVSELVPRELLPNALSLSAAVFNSARVIGPALAGLAIVVDRSTASIFLLNAATFLAPAVMLARMRVTDLHREVRALTVTRIRDGLRYIWRRDDLVLPLALLFVVGLAGFNFNLTLPVLSKVTFETGAGQFGLLMTALALGSLGGALAGTGRRVRPSAYTVIGAAVGFGALSIVAGLLSSYWLTALALMPTGFFMIYFAQATNQRLQLGTDAAYRGRVMAMFVLVFMGTTPLGGPAIGALSEHFGPRASIWGGGVFSLLAGLAALTWQLRRDGARVGVRLRPLPWLYVRPSEAAPAVAGAGHR
jgi:MFS family permease